MNAQRPSVRRRLRILRRQRLDIATTGFLAALVVASLVLARFLFFEPETAALVQAGVPAAIYHAPSAAVGRPTPENVILPEQLALLYAGGAGDTGLSTPTVGSSPDADYQEIWHAVRQVLGTVTAGQIGAARQMGFKPVAEALAGLETAPVSAGTIGVDVTLGYGISWRDLRAAAQSPLPASSPSPTFDRIVLLSGMRGGAPQMFLLSGAAATDVPLTSAQVAPLKTLVAGLRSHVVGAAYSLRPLEGAGALPAAVRQAVAAPQAILVPYGFPWQPVAMQPEKLRPQALATAIFPDMLDVAEGHSHGADLYTNSQHWLLNILPNAGQATLFVPVVTPTAAPGWYRGLQEVLGYVYRVGGWPASVWLAGSAQTPATCLAQCEVVARSYVFSVDAGGLPVVEASGSNAVSVTLAGNSGQPTSYSRFIPIVPPGGAPVDVSGQPIGAEEAAATALAATGQAGTEILQIFPAMTPRPGLQQLRPVWAVVLANPNPSGGGPQTALVDAYSGTLLSARAGGG